MCPNKLIYLRVTRRSLHATLSSSDVWIVGLNFLEWLPEKCEASNSYT